MRTSQRRSAVHRLTLLLVALLGALLLGGCVKAPRVLQGTVVSHDPATHRLVVKDELAPGSEVQLSIERAEIGAVPAIGDLVRVAYHESEGQLRATRVANITRQTEMKGGGGH